MFRPPEIRQDPNRRIALEKLREIHPSATTLLGHYSGGNDEGGYNGWTVKLADGTEAHVGWDGPRFSVTLDSEEWTKERGWHTVQRAQDVSLDELLDNAYEDAHGYGSFAGEFQVHGTVEIEVASGKVLSNHGQEQSGYRDF